MTRIAVLAGSSASGTACIKKLLLANSSSNTSNNLMVRGCFRTQERADFIQQSTVDKFPTSCRATYESHVGMDANHTDTLKRALEGVDRAMLVTPLDYSAGMQNDAANSIRMIQAAKEMGVKRIVHVGSWTVNAPTDLPILAARFQATEEYLESSAADDLEWTVLRGGYFMSNFAHVHLSSIKEHDSMLAVPDCQIPTVDVRDIGEAAAALLLVGDEEYQQYHGKHIECCGPNLLSHAEIAAELGAGLGRTINYPSDAPGVDEWSENETNPIMLELYKYMAGAKSSGVPFDPTTFAKVLGRQPTSLRQWASDHKDVFASTV
jgi:uncharacterized protein YbjT (DUF2867 family)